VLNCQGSGTNAGVIAGVDWVAANAVQPAVANMSLGGGANSSLDTAVNNAVAAGITFAVAAGNDSADACSYSPARAADAITVAATSAGSDARASFSNYGSCVDIHAPGSSIKGAWIGSSTATNTISGTSMASPHVAGLAASYLGANPGSSPAQVQAGLEAVANLNCVTSANGSPNLLIYNDFGATSQHDCGNGGGDPPGGNPASCIDNNACGGFAPSGCACDVWCIFFGDCCSDGPC
jgi:subtilisin family serine protease